MPRRPLRLAVGRGRDQTGSGGEFRRGGSTWEDWGPHGRCRTRRRQRTRLWSWSPSRRRRRGPRTSATPRRARRRAERRRRRWVLPVVLVPVVLVLLVLVIAWAVDTSSGEVARNVQLAGVDIGGLSEDELTGRVGDVAADFADTPVELRRRRRRLQTTAGDIGLMVDEERDHRAAPSRSARRSFLLARPFAWARVALHDQRGAACSSR